MTPDDQQRPATPSSVPSPADDEELAQSLELDENLDEAPADQPTAPPDQSASSVPSAAPVSSTSSEPVPSGGSAEPAPSDGSAEAVTAVTAESTETTADASTGRRRRTKDPKQRRKAPWWELPLLIVVAIVIAIVVKSFVVQPFFIPSGSMEKTLHGCPGCSGDRILVNKPIYDFRDPHPGDIVVFHKPDAWPTDVTEQASTAPSNPVLRWVRDFGQLIGFVPPDGEVLVKRVIAVGGQTVQGTTDDNGVTETITVTDANGTKHVLDEPFIYLDSPDTTATFGPVTVPKGRLWVMGDHRNASADSRYHCRPDEDTASQGQLNHCNPVSSTVPVSDVIGKAFVIAWPPSRWRTLGTPSTFKALADGGTIGSIGVVPAAVVVPVFLVRRRRRRRP